MGSVTVDLWQEGEGMGPSPAVNRSRKKRCGDMMECIRAVTTRGRERMEEFQGGKAVPVASGAGVGSGRGGGGGGGDGGVKIVRCGKCEEVLWLAEEVHCPCCHETLEKGAVQLQDHAEHVKACEKQRHLAAAGKGVWEQFGPPQPPSLRVKAVKAALIDVEVRQPHPKTQAA